MRVRIIDGTVAEGRTVTRGQILELSESEARVLLQTHRAELYEEPLAAEPEEATNTAATAALNDARGRTGRKAGR